MFTLKKTFPVILVAFIALWSVPNASADDQTTVNLLTGFFLAWEYHDATHPGTPDTDDAINRQQTQPTEEDITAMKDKLDEHQNEDGGLHLFPTDNETVEHATRESTDEAYTRNHEDRPPLDARCSLSLLPQKATRGASVGAVVTVPDEYSVGTVFCRVPGYSSFQMPSSSSNTFALPDAFSIPDPFTRNTITAVCFVNTDSEELICAPQATVEVDNTGPCAQQGFFISEVKSYAGREWQRCGTGGVHFDCLPRAVEYCQDLNLGGHTDWRLPTRVELESLVVTSLPSNTPSTTGGPYVYSPAHIDADFVCPLWNPNATKPWPEWNNDSYANNIYWTATAYSAQNNQHSVVYFYDGTTGYTELIYDEDGNAGTTCGLGYRYVRCVRDE